ncbi:MAG: TonB-dependent receptor [Gammaproteobacteria bacterium]|nr:TonB-dependent receptor [Gammaproteobacteria bacterium]
MSDTRKGSACLLQPEPLAAYVLALATLMPGATAAAQIEEVVVTAQKRAQSLQEVPFTVTAVDTEFLRNTGVGSVEDLQQHLPALNIAANITPFSAAIRLRGIGSQGNEPSIEPSVGFFVDGVYQPRSGLGLADLADIERIEVLYGPQSTLYGKNTNAGLVNVITKAPTSEIEGNLEFSTGDYALRDGRFSLSGPLVDTLSFRISGRFNIRDGYMDDLDPAGGGGTEELNDADDKVLRGQLLWQPNEALDVRLIATHVSRHQVCCSGELLPGPAHIALSTVFGSPLPSLDPEDRKVGIDFPYSFKQESNSVSGTIDYDFGAFTLTSITGYDEYRWVHTQDTDHSSLDWWRVTDVNKGDSVSQELRLVSNGDSRLNWLGGLFYYSATLDRSSLNNGYVTFGAIPGFVLPGAFPPPLTGAAGDTGFYDTTWEQETMAAFGQLMYDLTDKARLTGGLRFSHEERDAHLGIISRTASPFSIMRLLILPPIDEDLSFEDDSVTWTVSGQYSWTDSVMTFVNVATGSKAGGFNGAAGPRTGTERAYGEETSINYEVGAKTDWFDRRLRLNASFFYTEIEDFQNLSFDATVGAFFVDNAGMQTTMGMDVEATAVITDWMTVDAALEWLDAEYDEFTNGPCYFGRTGADPLTGFCDVSGEDLPWAPDITTTLAANFVRPVRDGLELYGRVDYSHVGDHIAADDLDPLAKQSYDLVNLRAGLRGSSWDVALWAKNVTDETYIQQQVGVPLFSGSYMRWLNPPRTWGVTLRYDF